MTDVTETQLDWEAAAKSLCEAVEAPAAKLFRKAADEVYADLLSDVQAFLRDNATFNLGSELARARREAREARDQLGRVAEALGTYRAGWPCGPTPKQVADEAISRIDQLKPAEQGVAIAERASIVAGLRERAVWLRDELSKGGSSELRPRAEESQAIADMVERGRFSVKEPA